MKPRIFKLGGTTVRDPQTVESTLNTLPLTEKSVLVVSAAGGITDQILNADWYAIRKRLALFAHAFCREGKHEFLAAVDRWLDSCATLSEPDRLAQGELWSADLIARALRSRGKAAHRVDARECIQFDGQSADVKRTDALLNHGSVPVVTGFIARNAGGETVTLGRDGSDYSAALLAEALQAEQVDFITDTRGIRTADPRLIQSTRRLSTLTYDEARLVTSLGGGVLHHRTIEPLQRAGIPARVYAPGKAAYATHIGSDSHSALGAGIFLSPDGRTVRLPVASAQIAEAIAQATAGHARTAPYYHVAYEGQNHTDAVRWITETHSRLFDTRAEVDVVLFGPGGVGQAAIDGFRDKQLAIRARHGFGIRLRGIVRTSGALACDEAGNLRSATVASLLESSSPLVVVDTTASDDVAGLHGSWLRAGHAVVTANKRALADSHQWHTLLTHRHYFPSATVGAGLPMLEGCRQRRLEGANGFRAVLSGSVNFILDRVSKGLPFSTALSEAQEAGYVEPDPRADLDGTDTTRKAVILARALGMDPTPDRISVESLSETSVSAAATSLRSGARLAYVATLVRGAITIRLEELAEGDFLVVSNTDNALQVLRNEECLLAVAGPGAGRDVTAAAIVRDCVAAAEQLMQNVCAQVA